MLSRQKKIKPLKSLLPRKAAPPPTVAEVETAVDAARDFQLLLNRETTEPQAAN